MKKSLSTTVTSEHIFWHKQEMEKMLRKTVTRFQSPLQATYGYLYYEIFRQHFFLQAHSQL